ncbi:MAG: hypothetical protein GWP06_00330 [Actinobacteria bacterium]|nr:hypothetical protein [Actinomycetota bacterium]
MAELKGPEKRLRDALQLVSPNSDGNKIYIAKWIGDPINKEKKLGLFDSPKTKGTKVQDLEIKGALHQLTFFFDDEDHDETAGKFWKSLDFKGSWAIVHPLLGPISNLYMSRATWEVEPVRSASFTTFNTNWIEGLPDGTTVSISEIKTNLRAAADDSDLSAGDQFESNILTDTFEQFNSLVSATGKASNAIKKGLRKFENLQLINPRLEALFNGIASTLESFPPDISALVSQFTGLYQAIGLAQNNAAGAIDNFINIISGQDDIITDDPGPNGRNAAAVAEFNLSLANTQIARSVTLPGLVTREQAIETATTINDYFTTMTNTLDAVGENFADTPIENQYVPQSISFGDQFSANKAAIQFLLNSALDLKVEKRFTIKIERSPLEIAWTELGMGEFIEQDGIQIDQNFADFCEWNSLHGADIMWLPSQTEVRIFV